MAHPHVIALAGTARRGAPLALTLATSILLSACGAIMHGSSQQIGISSSPTSARVLINGVESGVTPLVADLKRKGPHVIAVRADGYEPYEIALTRSVSGWVWGNLVFGGLIGLVVDASTGGLYKLSPEQISAELSRSGGTWAEEESLLYVRLVPRAPAGLERIGALTPTRAWR
jgi:hypothetical protein